MNKQLTFPFITKTKSKEELVKEIAKDTAKFIAREAVEKTPNVIESIEVMHNVVRHLMKKLGAERRSR